jgi:hypothetical protein
MSQWYPSIDPPQHPEDPKSPTEFAASTSASGGGPCPDRAMQGPGQLVTKPRVVHAPEIEAPGG